MATRYDNLRRKVENFEADPVGYPDKDALIEELRKAAAGGARYRKLYNRAQAALKAPERRAEKERRERAERKRKQMEGLMSVTPREATARELTGGFRTVSGGLPGTKR